MAPAQLERLYEPFNRLGQEHGTIEGTGIGLVLVKQLVERMGGAIHIESFAGKGTRVELTFPSYTKSGVDTDSQYDTQFEPGTSLAGKVLYVEDNPVNALLVQAYLGTSPDVHLQCVETAHGAIELAQKGSFDMILLDMGLPDMSGLEALRTLRTVAMPANVPIVVLSASALPSEIEAAMGGGATEYWTKPIRRGAFLRGMSTYLSAVMM